MHGSFWPQCFKKAWLTAHRFIIQPRIIRRVHSLVWSHSADRYFHVRFLFSP